MIPGFGVGHFFLIDPFRHVLRESVFAVVVSDNDLLMPVTVPGRVAPPRHDMSVVLVTGSYDHEVRFCPGG